MTDTSKTITRREHILSFIPSARRREEALAVFAALDRGEPPALTKSAPPPEPEREE